MKSQISLGMKELLILIFAILGFVIVLFLVFMSKSDVSHHVNYLLFYQPSE